MSFIKNILCTVDFSILSKEVIYYGKAIADKFSSNLLIFHSIPITSNDVTKISKLETVITDAEHKIFQLMSSVTQNWKPIVRIGDPVDEIIKLCPEFKIDMIIARSYGLSGLKRFLHGTIIERMARCIACPLLVIPSPKQAGNLSTGIVDISHIVLACDLSMAHQQMINYVFEFSKIFHSDIHIVHAMESPMRWEKNDIPYGPYEEIQRKQQQLLEEKLKTLIPKDSNLRVTTSVLQGVPEDVLMTYIHQHPTDLIVVGVKHHGTLNKIFIGATTEAILRKSFCPVLVIPSNFNIQSTI